MKRLLKEGDVFYLENNMQVYSEVPSKFVYSNAKKSNEKTHHELIVGKILTNNTDISTDVEGLLKDIIHAFEFRLGMRITKAEAQKMISAKVKTPKTSTFCLEGGEYIVIKTASEGGGFGMGMNDVYPDGYHVTCKKLDADGNYDENGIEIDFYQTGSFTAMIPMEKITLLRQMSKKFA